MTTTLKDTTAKDLSDLFNADRLAWALSYATANGQIETLRFLLDRGVEPDVLCAPLTNAKDPDVAKLLVERGAKRGLATALEEAAFYGNTDTVLFLLDRFGESFSEEELRQAHGNAVFTGGHRQKRSPDSALLLEWQMKHNKAITASVETPPPEPGAP